MLVQDQQDRLGALSVTFEIKVSNGSFHNSNIIGFLNLPLVCIYWLYISGLLAAPLMSQYAQFSIHSRLLTFHSQMSVNVFYHLSI